MILRLCLIFFSTFAAVNAASRRVPPPGAVIVRQANTTSEEFTSVGAALNSLPNDNSSQSVFIFPGTYVGQVNVSRPGPVTVFLNLQQYYLDA